MEPNFNRFTESLRAEQAREAERKARENAEAWKRWEELGSEHSEQVEPGPEQQIDVDLIREILQKLEQNYRLEQGGGSEYWDTGEVNPMLQKLRGSLKPPDVIIRNRRWEQIGPPPEMPWAWHDSVSSGPSVTSLIEQAGDVTTISELAQAWGYSEDDAREKISGIAERINAVNNTNIPLDDSEEAWLQIVEHYKNR